MYPLKAVLTDDSAPRLCRHSVWWPRCLGHQRDPLRGDERAEQADAELSRAHSDVARILWIVAVVPGLADAFVLFDGDGLSSVG